MLSKRNKVQVQRSHRCWLIFFVSWSSIINFEHDFRVRGGLSDIGQNTTSGFFWIAAYLSYHVGKHQASEIFIIKSQKSSFQWCRKLFIAFPFVLLCNARWLIKNLVTTFQLIKIKSEHYPYYFASISDWFKVLFASVDTGLEITAGQRTMSGQK